MPIESTPRRALPLVIFMGLCLLLACRISSQQAQASPSAFSSSSSSNSPLLLTICQVQGYSFSSPYQGQTVRVRGVVFADLDQKYKRGFFMQHEHCDNKTTTSDGIFVYIGPQKQDVVASGDRVEVTGVVQEYHGKTEINTLPVSVTILSSNSPLPAPVDLSPPFDNDDSRYYFETLEGMHVKLDEAVTVGPTSSSDETWVVRADLGFQRIFQDDPRGTGAVVCVDEDGLYEISPEVKIGDRVDGLRGALDYSLDLFRLQLLAQPAVSPIIMETPPADAAQVSGPFTFTVATFNLHDLFDTVDDPLKDDTVLSSTEYQRRLQKRLLAVHTELKEPHILAVQEVESLAVLQDLVGRPEIQADYDAVWVDGPDPRGLEVAVLYRADLLELVSYQTRQDCTTLIDGLGPDGNDDVHNPQNALACDTDGNGTFDGNRLFSRPPLVARFKVCPAGCQEPGGEQGEIFYLQVIANHWKSKTEDTRWTEYTQPRRILEAQFVSELVQEIHSANPDDSLLILGDLNDFPVSQPLTILKNAGLVDLVSRIEKSARYTYVFQGVSQVLDYVLFYPSRDLAPVTVTPVHINADYPAIYEGQADTFLRSSDHDPLLVAFTKLQTFSYLPVISAPSH